MKIKTRCLKCKRVRYVTPLFKDTPKERALIRKHYVCVDCDSGEWINKNLTP